MINKDFLLGFGAGKAAGGGGGGGGGEIETGTWTPSEDIARGTISFKNTHETPPYFLMISDATGTADEEKNTNHFMVYYDPYRKFGAGFPYSSTGFRYCGVIYGARGTSTSSINIDQTTFTGNSDATSESSNAYPRYWVNVGEFHPYTNSGTRYWRANRTYKWVAIW